MFSPLGFLDLLIFALGVAVLIHQFVYEKKTVPENGWGQDSLIKDLYAGKEQDLVGTRASTWIAHQVLECLWAIAIGRLATVGERNSLSANCT